MAADRNLVFISFFANPRSAAKNSCDAILTQLRPFSKTDSRFEVWDRSLIPPGRNKDDEIKAALERCRIAVVLVTPEYLDSEHWAREAEPLLVAAEKGDIHLLWLKVSPSNCDVFEISKIQPLFPDVVLTKASSSRRNKLEQEISEYVFDCWKEFTPCSRKLAALPITQLGTHASEADPKLTLADAVALVLTASGEEKQDVHSYGWSAFVQWSGQCEYHVINNGEIGASPTFEKNSLCKLVQRLKRWMATKLEDVSVLEIFAPAELLDADWGGMSVGDEDHPMHSFQPYLLRSLDRLLDPEMREKKGSLKRMYDHLVAGTGAWLPQDQLSQAHRLQTLDGQTINKEARGVITAICCLQGSAMTNKTTWLRWAQKSMAPLVVWPSRKGALSQELPANEVWSCVGELSLNSEDTCQGEKIDRPHCPDLLRLAKMRQTQALEDWPHPKIDLGLSILVDHPDRAPDLTDLQHLLSISRQDPSRAPEGEPLASPAQLLISPG